MKLKSVDLKWLPPATEWDFRLIIPSECRVACHWEYNRDRLPKNAAAKESHLYCPQNYHAAAREFFPRAWLTLSNEHRQRVVETFHPSPAIQVRKMRELWKQIPVYEKNPGMLQPFLSGSYVMIPNFRLRGVEAVIKEFAAWARKEAKQHPQSRRAQAAELPFDALKWLAATRLERARQEARITIERAREAITAYQKQNRVKAENDAYPAYASDGAWIKAVKNAEVCWKKVSADPSHLLGELI